jgi:hypothetical protein
MRPPNKKVFILGGGGETITKDIESNILICLIHVEEIQSLYHVIKS